MIQANALHIPLKDESVQMSRQTAIAYIAGIADGEAYFGIKKTRVKKGCQNPSYHARVQIRMVDIGAINFIKNVMGGNFYKEKPHCNNGRPLYCYQISDRAAQKFLENIFQYLIVKRKQAEVIFDLRLLQKHSMRHKTKITGYRTAFGRKDKVPNYSYSDEYINECEELYLKCKELNKVGLK